MYVVKHKRLPKDAFWTDSFFEELPVNKPIESHTCCHNYDCFKTQTIKHFLPLKKNKKNKIIFLNF